MLEKSGLADPFLPYIGTLAMLEKLDLYYNNLTGTIPPELGELVMLRRLFLPDNYLAGPIPPELGKLTMLKAVFLSGNDLSGCVPSVSQTCGSTRVGWTDASLEAGSIAHDGRPARRLLPALA